jgi:SAM-dependent methyltransferase
MPVSSVPIEMLACPRCHAALKAYDGAFGCVSAACYFHTQHFASVSGTPVLVDFDNSILDREQTLQSEGASPLAGRDNTIGLRRRISNWLRQDRRFEFFDAKQFLAAAKAVSDAPVILVIGGGSIGLGAEALYEDPQITLIGTDIYQSPHVSLVSDAHQLPFRDGSVHGVWIQAVLEHVLDPQTVVAEIHRVLAADGVVYAETPFMQQVHEGAWDFTRFSRSGHRWLFRHFAELSAGVTQGPAISLQWAIRHFLIALLRSYRLGNAVSLAFFWIKYFDRLIPRHRAGDGACGLFFFGRRSAVPVTPKQMVDYYEASVEG